MSKISQKETLPHNYEFDGFDLIYFNIFNLIKTATLKVSAQLIKYIKRKIKQLKATKIGSPE